MNSTTFIASKISEQGGLSIKQTKYIMLKAIESYLNQKNPDFKDDLITLEGLGLIAHDLLYVYNEFDDIYRRDQELCGVLHDLDEITIPNRSPETIQKVTDFAKEYFQNNRNFNH